MQYYQFHLGDYMSATSHLTPIEDIAYRRLIDLYYRTEEPIGCKCNANAMQMDMICRATRMQDFSEIVERVLREFFVETENGWINERCEEELSRVRDLKQVRSKAATKRWNSMQKQCKSNAKAMLPNTHYPLPITQDPLPKTHTGAGVSSNGFSEKIQEVAFRVLGMVPPATLAEWIATYGEEWTRDAMLTAEQAGKKRSAYVAGILKRWTAEGRDEEPTGDGGRKKDPLAEALRKIKEKKNV